MEFGDMRQRVLFLSSGWTNKNELNENTSAWVPVHPGGAAIPVPPFYLPDECVRIDTLVMGQELDDAMKRYGVWAAVKPMTGREYEEAQKLRAETTYKVKVRYFPALQSNMRMVYRDKIFDIVSVLDLNSAKRELQLICTEADDYGKETG